MQTEMFEKWKEINDAALEPVVKANQIAARAVERFTKQQLGFVSEGIRNAVKQGQSLAEVKNIQDFIQKQTVVASEMADKIQAQAQETLELVLEVQAEFSALAEENFKAASAKMEEGVKAVAAKVEESVKVSAPATKKPAAKKAA